MEVKINREIRDYKEKLFFGLTMRQFIFALLACVVGLILYLVFKPHLEMEPLSWVCLGGAAPFAIVGFVKYNGMTVEKFIVVWIKSEILTPKKLFYRPYNYFHEIVKLDKEREKEQRK